MDWIQRKDDNDGDAGGSGASNDGNRSGPDPAEMRRRRLARLEEDQARKKDLEERKAKWEAQRAAEASAAAPAQHRSAAAAAAAARRSLNSSPVVGEGSESATATRTGPAKPTKQNPPAKRVADDGNSSAQNTSNVRPRGPQLAGTVQRPLPPYHVLETNHVARSLMMALSGRKTSDEFAYLPELLSSLTVPMDIEPSSSAPSIVRETSGAPSSEDTPRYVLRATEHTDEILMSRINDSEVPLAYLLSVYSSCESELSSINSNRRYDPETMRKLTDAVKFVMSSAVLYTGMVLRGDFTDDSRAKPEAFAGLLMNPSVEIPGGFISDMLERYSAGDGVGVEDLRPTFTKVFMAVRQAALASGGLSAPNFLAPLKALARLVSHKQLCVWLVEDPCFVPATGSSSSAAMGVHTFCGASFLAPFFTVSVLPGLPLENPRLGVMEDASIGLSYFPSPTTDSKADVEAAVVSLRSSLQVARMLLCQVCKTICKAGDRARNAMLSWFGTVLNMNKKRAAMRVDYRNVSGDGFMMNVTSVLLHLAEPVVQGGWKMLEKIDPTYPQSNHRLNYEDETRLAADSDMLKRWWVDKRNKNAQESLMRSLEHAAKEAGSGPSSSAAASSDTGAHRGGETSDNSTSDDQRVVVSVDFKFTTEVFFLALRAVQLGFVPITTLYSETLLRSLSRLRDIVQSLEGIPSRTPRQDHELGLYKARFDSLVRTKFCYDVYMKDEDLLTALVRVSSGTAEWLVKKVLAASQRESLLPLPVPPDAVFASLPEHVAEVMATVLITTWNHASEVIDRNTNVLDEIVTFAIVAASSPLHVKNPYLRAKLVEFLALIFPRPVRTMDDGDDEPSDQWQNPVTEALFLGHTLSCKYLPSALFRLYVDVEHTGSHTQFYDKFSIRYRIGTIIESAWNMPAYRASIRSEAADETRLMRFINMLLNDANHLLDETLNDLEEIHRLEVLIDSDSPDWTALSTEEKTERKERHAQLQNTAMSNNQLSNNNVKLLCLLTGDDAVRKVFLRPEMVSRIAEMLNYLLSRLCGERCRDLKVSDPERVAWKPKLLLALVMKTFTHFHEDASFARSVSSDGRSYSPELLSRAAAIATRRTILHPREVRKFVALAKMAAEVRAVAEQEELDLGEVPEEFLDPIMSTIMERPVRLPTSGKVMDRDVISRILLSDGMDPFNRMALSEDMLEEDHEMKKRIEDFKASRRAAAKGSSSSNMDPSADP